MEEEKEKLVSLDTVYKLPWIWDCISILSRESILHFLDLVILNCVGCIFKAVLCLVLFSSSWLSIMNPSLYQSYQNSKGEAQRYVGTGSGHLAQWSCSYLVCPSPWIPPLTQNNRRKWMTLSDWIQMLESPSCQWSVGQLHYQFNTLRLCLVTKEREM